MSSQETGEISKNCLKDLISKLGAFLNLHARLLNTVAITI
jgi:hypothetical protein